MENIYFFILRVPTKKNDQASNYGVKQRKLFILCIIFLFDKWNVGEIYEREWPGHQDIQSFDYPVWQHLSNQNRIEGVFGQDFVEKRTANCQ